MKLHKTLIGIVLMLALILGGKIASAQPPKGMGPPPMGPSGICADENYLYVMQGGKIMQYGVADMALKKTVKLPAPPKPSDAETKAKAKGSEGESDRLPPPPPMGGALWEYGTNLYVLAGPVVYVYTLPDLTPASTLELPKPEASKLNGKTHKAH